MKIRELVSDIGTGMIGGYVGTQVMERVSMKLYELEPEEDQQKEEEVRPGPPFYIAAKKITEALGIELSEEQLQNLAMYGFHYGLGMGWDRHTTSCGDGRTSTRFRPGCSPAR